MTAGKVLLGVLTCVAVGAMIGILFAPKKGSVTRRFISKKGKEYAGELEGKFNKLIDSINEKIESLKEEATRVTKLGKVKAAEAEAKLNNVAN